MRARSFMASDGSENKAAAPVPSTEEAYCGSVAIVCAGLWTVSTPVAVVESVDLIEGPWA